MYNPGLGRFMTEDPLGLEAGPNPYDYCNNDPTNETDPSGLKGAPTPITPEEPLPTPWGPEEPFPGELGPGGESGSLGPALGAGGIILLIPTTCGTHDEITNDDLQPPINHLKDDCYRWYYQDCAACKRYHSARDRALCYERAAIELDKCIRTSIDRFPENIA